MDFGTESIYNLIPKPKQGAEKKLIYRSKYDPNAPLTGSTFGLHGTTVTVGNGVQELKKTRKINCTFGPNPEKPNPTQFLRKGTRRSLIKGSPSKKVKHSSVKPPVPSSGDKPVMGILTNTNFIESNVHEAIMQEPKNVKKAERLFIEKETYGKIPKYLSKVRNEVQREKEIIEEHVKRNGQSTEIEYEVMDEDERQMLINALKAKWDAVNCNYQKICFRTTLLSLGDMNRKEAQEAELQQLEEDIERLSKPGPLYIKSP